MTYFTYHRRLSKEKQMYEKEVVDEEAKVERMKAAGRDEYDIRKQVIIYSQLNAVAHLVLILLQQ